jgi:hypothetical protein
MIKDYKNIKIFNMYSNILNIGLNILHLICVNFTAKFFKKGTKIEVQVHIVYIYICLQTLFEN